MKNFTKFFQMRVLLIICVCFLTSHAAYPTDQSGNNCPNLSDNDFSYQILASRTNGDNTMMEPLKMAFDMDAQGNVTVYWIERAGKVKYYNGSSVQTAGTIPGVVRQGNPSEDGLIGIELDPKFKENRWMYLMYSIDQEFRLSRYTLNGNSIDISSEVRVLSIPSGRGRWHTGGDMHFDAYGDLWIAVGDNEFCELGPGNTADLRGGILRIHPNPDGSYSIPSGNLWEFAAEHYSGDAGVAADYRDESKARREIYSMGTRNAYTLSLDPVRRWAVYGDCGPDVTDPNTGSNRSEEHQVITEPSNEGWPYWSGADCLHPGVPNGYDESGESNWDWNSKNMSRPVNNNSRAAGVDVLLPASPALHVYGHQCAITGPIYRYDGDLDSDVKFPPHFDRKWIVADWNQSWKRWVALSNDGKSMSGQPQDFLGNARLYNMLDMEFGPDGALYVVNYSGSWYSSDNNTSIAKISYTGSCKPDTPKLEKAGCTDPDYVEYDSSIPAEHSDSTACITPVGTNVKGIQGGVLTDDLNIFIENPGNHMVQLINLKGEVIFSAKGTKAKEYLVNKTMQPGIYFLTINTGKQRISRKLMIN